MRPTAFPAEHIVEHVRHSKVLTMDQIHQQVGCSRMTAWRALRAQGYYTSYNYNASYYTLADIPAFDAQGLWAFRDIRFSCHGTLIQTLMTWIDQSAAGYQAEELSQLLAVPVAPALSRLHARGRVCREKMGGGIRVRVLPGQAASGSDPGASSPTTTDAAPGGVARSRPNHCRVGGTDPAPPDPA